MLKFLKHNHNEPPPAGMISLPQALKVLDDHGFKFTDVMVHTEHLNYDVIGSAQPHSVVGSQYVEVRMRVDPPLGKHEAVVTAINDAVCLKGLHKWG